MDEEVARRRVCLTKKKGLLSAFTLSFYPALIQRPTYVTVSFLAELLLLQHVFA